MTTTEKSRRRDFPRGRARRPEARRWRQVAPMADLGRDFSVVQRQPPDSAENHGENPFRDFPLRFSPPPPRAGKIADSPLYIGAVIFSEAEEPPASEADDEEWE
jgi:hypothetical protein